MNAAKHARRLKEIRRVKAAMRFREAQRKRWLEEKEKRLLVKDHQQRLEELERGRKTAIQQSIDNAAEDWKRAHLRPNRAGGTKAAEYGAVPPEQLRSNLNIPKHWVGIDESSPRKSNTPKIPDAVRLNQWPIAKGDRVVVMQGPDAGKIGTVTDIRKDEHSLIVDDLNMGYLDSKDMVIVSDQQQPEPKMESAFPLDYSAVRLVIPKVFERTVGGRTIKETRDVIVEDIIMEKHTSGVDPFTRETVLEIPKEHQVDPHTGKAIWHRYIAGTREPIPWPWEKEPQQDEDDLPEAAEPEKTGVKSLLEKANPLTWFGKGKKDGAVSEPSSTSTPEQEETYDPKKMVRGEPNEYEPPDFDDDTTRNYVDEKTFVPVLTSLPIPPTVIEELNLSYRYLREHQLERRAANQAAKEAKERERQARIDALARMKTPMQIRYELMQAKKIKYDPKSPAPPHAQLLAALGKHIASKKVNGESKKVQRLAA
ncbi:uncharacterized protein EI97DRAFT_436298 [Westerdykella ornata]|uniref:KOW domain-containing protein n=1 Tax=Westerdykella ornata TaxID=318751 RepID=A0A6A6JAP4_WESOR|nr:uncharacterized protein EI97DRAFT_436298 [Westerdykella ornata]KAF2273243.1 hypothetical protein EI97DRAFT_436298 [Westerdykella ornata]